MLFHVASRAFATAKELLSTSQCVLCDAWPSDTPFAVCQACLTRHMPPVQRCTTCGIALADTAYQGADHLCHRCRQHPPPLDECMVAVDYAEPWASLIRRFKFQQDTGWAEIWAHLLHQRLQQRGGVNHAHLPPLHTDWVIPIPMHPQALSQRGYNQSWVLCMALKKKLQIHPIEDSQRWQFRHDVLLKTTATQQQHRLKRSERQHNLQTAFAVAPHAWAALQGRSVTLVDDVFTTGATLHAAATALRQQGAAHVQAWVIARTPNQYQNQ
jgi:ComF family protein